MSSHGQNIVRRLTVATAMVLPGMIVSCEYTNRHGKTKKYLVMCINPNYKGEFHCYKLGNFKPDLIKSYGLSYGLKNYRGIDYLNVGNPQSFYNDLKNIGKRDYKKFEPSSMASVQICSYKYVKI